MIVSKVGVLRDMVTGELEGVLILSLPDGEEIPCGIAVDDAQALLSLDWGGEGVEDPDDVERLPPMPAPAPPASDPLGPINPADRRAHAAPAPGGDGYGFDPARAKVKIP